MKKLAVTFVVFTLALNSAMAGNEPSKASAPPRTPAKDRNVRSTALPSSSSSAPLSKKQLELKIIEAVKEGNVPLVKELLAQGADVNTINENTKGKINLLYFSSLTGNAEMVSTLINHGANLEAIAATGHTPLMVAAIVDQVEVVKILVEAGANLEARQPAGQNILQQAAIEGSVESLKYLISLNRFDVNEVDRDGLSPLMSAAEVDDERYLKKAQVYHDTVRLLIEAGAEVDLRTAPFADGFFHDKTALSLAIKKNRHAIVAILQEKGASDPLARGLIAAERQEQEKVRAKKERTEAEKQAAKNELDLARLRIEASRPLAPVQTVQSAQSAQIAKFKQLASQAKTAMTVVKAGADIARSLGALPEIPLPSEVSSLIPSGASIQ